jgi:hypothetical protein
VRLLSGVLEHLRVNNYRCVIPAAASLRSGGK